MTTKIEQKKCFVGCKNITETSKIPSRANFNDAGFDLYSDENITIKANSRQTIKTGVAFQIQRGFAGLIWPRSGLAVKQGIDVLAGVIDSGYRGEVMVCLYNTSNEDVKIDHGDRVAQIIFQELPMVSLLSIDTLDDSQRGSNGFGSTGK